MPLTTLKTAVFICILPFFGFSQVNELAPPNYIKTVNFKGNTPETQLPIVKLGEQVVLEFDALNGDEADYYYKIDHYNFDWVLSSYSPSLKNMKLKKVTMPVFNKVSTSRALTFSWLNPNKQYDLNTNTNGEHRAFVVTGSYEEVFPLDIYPMQILKSCLYKDLDEMEVLGMYEVAPEDFALTEFVCVSKQPHQKIIRQGLDLMLKEIG